MSFENLETLRRFFVIKGAKSIWFKKNTLGVQEVIKEEWPICEIDKPEPSPICTLSWLVNSLLWWRLLAFGVTWFEAPKLGYQELSLNTLSVVNKAKEDERLG